MTGWPKKNSIPCLAVIGALSLIACVGASAEPQDGAKKSVVSITRRLSPAQYRQTIADIFGSTIQLGGRFEPERREAGLLAVGAARVSMTPTGLAQYDVMARTVAAQVVDLNHRDALIGCKPTNLAAADDSCAGAFLSRVGRLLYRRPLTPTELDLQTKIAAKAAASLKSFYAGLEMSLAGMLASPQFLFRQETGSAPAGSSGAYTLDAFSKASRLSFFLWNAAPDNALLKSAEQGELDRPEGLARHVDRMMASSRLEDGLRVFFSDMLGFDEFASLSKDSAIYPKFTTRVARDAQEQTLRTIIDHVLVQNADYRDLFITRKTFLTPLLAAVYGVALTDDEPNGTPDAWVSYEFPEGSPRSGLLTQASFVALHSHPGRSSPTLRGKALREILLCQKVPDPPANVNFTVVQDTANPQYKTTRDRVTAHRTDPTCAGCHKLIDPMGLALENFDSSGGFRKLENNVGIDASGELDGVKFSDAQGLASAMHDHSAVPACLVSRIWSYGVGRAVGRDDAEFVKSFAKKFESSAFRVPDLMRAMAQSASFYTVSSQ